MKLRKFILFFSVCLFMTACSDDNEEGRKVTDYKEYTLTVASVRRPGVLTSIGSNALADVYAVKNEPSTDWKAHGNIGNFEYEEGYEYQIRISETSYLDYSMGDSAWTEYELLEVISKERKDSENLPPHFIPNWYFEQRCPYINPEFAYAIEADQKDEIENDLKIDATYQFGGLRYYICFATRDWFLLNADMHTIEKGTLIMRSKDITEFPETYKLLPPESKVDLYGEFNFVKGDDIEDSVMQYDVFISAQNRSRDFFVPQNVEIWLYKDLTAYYQSKYPAANVNAVVIRYTVKIL